MQEGPTCMDFVYNFTRFKTPRQVVIHDTCVSVLFLGLRFLVVLYVVLIQFMLNHAHAEFETPSAYANMWASSINANTLQGQPIPDHCSDTTTLRWGDDFTPSESQAVGGINITAGYTCVPFNDQMHTAVQAGAGTFSAVTWEGIRYQENGTTVVVNRFTDHPELAIMNMIHVITTTWLDAGLGNVQTSVLDKDGAVVAQFPSGEYLTGIPIGQWLDLGGLPDLNVKLIQPVIRGGDPAFSPARRVTGAVVLLQVQYSNYRAWELTPVPRAQVTVQVLPEAWGFMGSDQVYDVELDRPVQRTRTAITLQVVQGGSYGQSRWENVVLRLVEAVVLLGLAHFLTGLIARFILYRGTFSAAVNDEVHLAHGIRASGLTSSAMLKRIESGGVTKTSSSKVAVAPLTDAGGDLRTPVAGAAPVVVAVSCDDDVAEKEGGAPPPDNIKV